MFGKFFASTFTGSMYGAGTDVFAVWGYVIAATVDGRVELNPSMLGAMLGATPERIEAAIAWLERPDSKSRNTKEGGRRLIREGPFQFRVVSHALYRAIRNEDDRRAYNRDRQRESRARRFGQPGHPAGQSPSLNVAHTEAEAEAETETEHDMSGVTPPAPASPDAGGGTPESAPRTPAPEIAGAPQTELAWIETGLWDAMAHVSGRPDRTQKFIERTMPPLVRDFGDDFVAERVRAYDRWRRDNPSRTKSRARHDLGVKRWVEKDAERLQAKGELAPRSSTGSRQPRPDQDEGVRALERELGR